MRIGLPKEIKTDESRVGLTPAAVKTLCEDGHEVYVETLAGQSIGFSDQHYRASGATIIKKAERLFNQSDLIIKVKEPQESEYKLLSSQHTLFTYLHLAASNDLIDGLKRSGCKAIAYESVRDPHDRLPLLAPMSQVAGRMAAQVAAEHLMLHKGGLGKLMGGVPGVEPAKVTILGGGVVGTEAAKMAIGLGADVTIVDQSLARLSALDDQFHGRLKTQVNIQSMVDRLIVGSDAVIGAVLIPGKKAPKLVNKSHLTEMKNGSVLVDVAIDQGGCFESSKPTTHSDPTYLADGVIHYCVANMPGAVARTSTEALVAATLPYIRKLANGIDGALSSDPCLAAGLSIDGGKLLG